MKINENIAFARSILRKNSISNDSEEYQDYLNIRKICGNSNGYVGILTKIRFVDGIEDMDEIESIFNILKDSSINVNNLNKMSYDEILDMFYEEMNKGKNIKDYELIYKDSEYSYYKVYTHQGILQLSSPAWCLKTKSHYDNYTKDGAQQWIVINNKYKKNIITPNNSYLQGYSSSKHWIRYGITLEKDGFMQLHAFDDNNNKCVPSADSHTYYGIYLTLWNLVNGRNKSFYEYFPGCERYGDSTYHLVKDVDRVSNVLGINDDHLDDYRDGEIYILLSKGYDHCPILLLLNSSYISTFYPKNGDHALNTTFSNIKSKTGQSIITNFAKKDRSSIYAGILLNSGDVTMDQLEKNKYFIKKVGKWLIFDKKSHYQVVNTDVSEFQIPTFSLNSESHNMENPAFFYIGRDLMNLYKIRNGDHEGYSKEVIDYLKSLRKEVKDIPQKKVKGFWDFLN